MLKVIGHPEVTLLELASAYATLARGGIYPPLVLIANDERTRGKRVFSAASAYIISDILADDDARRMSFGEDSPLNLGFKVAAKTGTTNDFRDNWTLGYTPDIAVGVWIGNADYTPMKNISGLTGAAPLWSNLRPAFR